MLVSDMNDNHINGHKLAIAWIDLTYYCQSLFKRQKDPILDGISGSVNFRTLTALMGPSGAGKTTLLKCINGRQNNSDDSNIYLSAEREIKSCFIVQEVADHLLKGLTALQALVYASKLKNMNRECDHKSNARKLMSELLIGDTEKTAVEKCSGGEQKRLAIAQELTAIDKPNLLCIDEPTSGLDSNAAEIVIQCLQEVSRQHSIAVVTSIHQPNSDVLTYFDRMYVLAKGGVCIYDGPPQNLPGHLKEAGIELKKHQFPIEVLMKMASIKDEKLDPFLDITKKSWTGLEERCLTEGKLCPQGVPHKPIRFTLGHFAQILFRASTCQFRSQWKAMVFQFMFVMISITFATKLFNKHCGQPDGCFSMNSTNRSMTREDELKIESLLIQNFKLQFFVEMMLQFLLTFTTVLLFAPEVRIFFNEHKNGWYSTGSYYWAKTLVELPFLLVVSTCYALIAYNMNDQINEMDRMLAYVCICIACVICCQGLAFLIGIVSVTNDKLAMVLISGTYLCLTMLMGFVAPIKNLPFEGLSHVSFVKHSFENRIIILYGFDRCPELQYNLYRMGLSNDTNEKFWNNWIILGAHTIIFRVMALIVLLFKANPIRIDLDRIWNRQNKFMAIKNEDQDIPDIVHVQK